MYNVDWDKYLPKKRNRKPKSITAISNKGESLDRRNAFESDFGRVIFSAAARRMHDKTQVFPLTSGDYVHTRLTHSLEVMNIAVSLGSSLCRNEEFVALYEGEGRGKKKVFELEQKICAVLKTAAFVHDIGNPPFGHYGEDTIQKYFTDERWKKYLIINDDDLDDEQKKKRVTELWQEYDSHKIDFTEFDGNAEGFRILTKGQYLGDLYGLNLTYATLGAYLKYPNEGEKEEGYVGRHKHGIFATEHEIFNEVVEACHMRKKDGTIKRHPLSFLVEAADTICYTAMDLEDGITTGKISIDEVCAWVDSYIEDNANHADFLSHMLQDGRFSLKKLLEIEKDPYAKKNDVNFRVALIAYLVNLAIKNFIDNLKAIDEGTYSKELLDDDPLLVAKALGKYARMYLFTNNTIISAELAGRSVIKGLLDIVLEKVLIIDPEKDERIYRMMSDSGLKLVHQEKGLYDPNKDSEFKLRIKELPLYNRLRLVVDWISGMTDKYALETYQKLSGIKL